PSAIDVWRALEAQTAPSKRNMKSICKFDLNTVSIQCMLYPMAMTTFSSLISHTHSLDAIRDCEGPTSVMLIYNPSVTAKYGGFKKALFGHLSLPISTGSTAICIKQCWYMCKALGAWQTYDSHTQIAKLSAEINCLHWASALMEIVYSFVYEYIEAHSAPTFTIPRMCFVKSTLAISDATCETYMIEEVIDEARDGMF
ncbi:hypothetical protein L208DRAFT_1165412, partial [Tricholoma matsutake]